MNRPQVLASPLRAPAERVLGLARRRGTTLAVAESLTGGMVASSLVEVPGSSAVLVGAIVAYATRIKAEVLGVDAAHLQRTGPVDALVAQQMAAGAARLMGAEAAVSTTGVAGPGPADGHRAGTVHIAACAPWARGHRELLLPGGRDEVRIAAAEAALSLLAEILDTPA
ncbi:CinA family protein [Actinomyces bowdenii]|uniref:CinA family protein n=1 Tax=Actinomyces bowdenii TaxID=131109 RepID=UPI001FD40CAC|nr:CinA family protein [Actinomyces bowdenii]